MKLHDCLLVHFDVGDQRLKRRDVDRRKEIKEKKNYVNVGTSVSFSHILIKFPNFQFPYTIV